MRVWAIIAREWQEYLLRGRWFIFGLAYPTVVVVPLLLGNGHHPVDPGGLPLHAPQLEGVTPEQLLRINEAILFSLFTPVTFSLQFAVQGLMAEKQSGTLEPLLAAPVRTWEILLGKAIAAVVPGVLTTWFVWLVAIAVVALTMPGAIGVPFLPTYLLQIFLVTPLITVAGALAGLAVAARIGEARVAQQVAGFIQLPFILGVGWLAMARMLIPPSLWLTIGVGLVVLAFILLQLAVRLFHRETMLTRGR